MKSKLILLTLFLPLVLSGCVLSANVETLIEPPKLNAEQQDIYNALKSYTGENIVLNYPKAGKYLSAFIIENIDDDEENEAIVFYKKNAAKSDDDSLRINILDTVDSKWHSVYDQTANGNEIEQVEITKLGDSDKINIITGYRLINQNEKKLSIYDYSDGKLNAYLSDEPYSVFQTVDLNNDGTKELFTACEKTSSENASAVSLHLYNDGKYKRSELSFDNLYTSYCNIATGADANGKTQIFLDAHIGDENIVTEVLKADANNNLLSEFSPDVSKAQTHRTHAYQSADIDNDRKAEIPVPYFCEGYDENSINPVFFTSWYELKNKKLKHKYESYTSITDGYVFLIPTDWYGKVTAKADISKNEISLCSGNEPETAEEIFTVKIVSGKEISTISEETGWMLIRTKGEKHFFLKINETNPLAVSPEEIIMKFKFDY